MINNIKFYVISFIIWAFSMVFINLCFASGTYTTNQVTVNDIEGNTIYVGTVTSGTPFVEFNSTTSGILPPVMTTTQMNAISSPQAGEFIYNSSNTEFEFYNGSTWGAMAAPVTSGTALLSGNGSGGITNVTIGTGLNYNTSSNTLSLTSGSWVPNNIQIFTSSGTWTQPAGVTKVYVKVVGAGGPSPGGVSGYSCGGAGGYAEGPIAVTGNVTVTIGSTNSFAGTTTISATAGETGQSAASATGGTGSGGSINITGQSSFYTTSAYSPPTFSVMGQIGAGGCGEHTTADPGAVIVYY